MGADKKGAEMDITVLTCTYGRPYFLVEAVESFRRQIIPEGVSVEMLIFNDCIEQPLKCNVSGVRVVNTGANRVDLTDVVNAAFEESRGDWVAPLDDDDISLPFRLKQSWEFVSIRPSIKAVRQQRAWVWHDGKIINRERNLFIGSSLINRKYYFEVGACTPGCECWDLDIWDKMMTDGGAFERNPTPRKTNLIYRWSGMGYHFSGLMDGIVSPQELTKLYHEGVKADKRFVAGEVEIVPEWMQDYEGMVKAAIVNRIGG